MKATELIKKLEELTRDGDRNVYICNDAGYEFGIQEKNVFLYDEKYIIIDPFC